MTTDSGKQTPLNLGPECKCNATEARCAWVGGCCSSCRHWDGYDDNGDELPTKRPAPDELTARRRAKWRAEYRKKTA